MNAPRATVLAGAAAALALAAGTPAAQGQGLSSDQESACGAILCLLGGSAAAACAPYLARYFAIGAPSAALLAERRLDFLRCCPAPGLPRNVLALIVRHGAECRPARLVATLNRRLEACEARAEDAAERRACAPRGDEWRRRCGAFYGSGYSAREPPVLVEDCRRVREDGRVGERCATRWAAGDTATETGE